MARDAEIIRATLDDGTWLGGSTLPKARIPKFCSADNCNNPSYARLLCKKHYARWRQHGDITVNNRTKHQDAERFYREVVLPYRGDDCLIWPFGRGSKGYARISKRGKEIDVHRKVCEDTYGPPPSPKHIAAHLCGNGHSGCCAPNHLTWGTKKENCEHSVLHGTSSCGSKNPKSKLSESDVKAILSHKGRTKQYVVADMFSVTRHTIQHIWRGKSWTHLKD